MSHWRVPVLASVVRHFFVLYEVISTVNLEVNGEVQLSFHVHIDDPFPFVLSNSYLLLLIKHITLEYHI